MRSLDSDTCARAGRLAALFGGLFIASTALGQDVGHPACGTPFAGCCFVANDTPGCNGCETADGCPSPAIGCDASNCCNAVCKVDPSCCDDTWDQGCADAAFTLCEFACGNAKSGDCFQANKTPYCDDETCCQTVCEMTPACCSVQWDAGCATDALNNCDGCGTTNAGDCFEAGGNGTPFCNMADCCELVCQADFFCCADTWDAGCANSAIDACQIDCGTPKSGDCFLAGGNGTPACNIPECCVIVCGQDVFCCDTEWDGICADEAIALCNCMPEDAPLNDSCDTAETIALGTTLIANRCADVQQPSHAGCNDGFLDGLGNDIWYVFTANYTGPLSVSTCLDIDTGCLSGSGDCFNANETPGCDETDCCAVICALDPSCCDVVWDADCAEKAGIECLDFWNTQLAVYNGDDCGSLGEPVACNQLGAGCILHGSQVALEVSKGQSYLVRVGSEFDGPSGTTQLTLSDDLPQDCYLDIPEGVLEEIEPCGNNTNGGCNFPGNIDCCSTQEGAGCSDSDCEEAVCNVDPTCCDTAWSAGCASIARDACGDCPAPTTSLPLGEMLHGTAWADGDARDTDWYTIQLESPAEVTLTVSAEFPVLFGFVEQINPGSGLCADATGFISPSQTGPGCLELTVSETLPEGTHHIFVAPDTFNDIECPGVAGDIIGVSYLLRADIPEPSCTGDTNGDGEVDVQDLTNLILDWATDGSANGSDLDENGIVDVSDLTLLILNWGECS